MHDLRYAFRQLIKSPGFTLVALVTLALGLGVNATVFAFVRDWVLHPLTQQTRQHLVAVYTKRTGPGHDFRKFTYAEFTALRESHEVFSDVTAFSIWTAAIGRTGEFKRSFISFVPENYFAALGTSPNIGRFFTAEEARPGAGLDVVVANHSYWQRMGGRSDFVGSLIQINQRTFTVVGIAPQGFGGLHASIGPDVWLPLGAMQSLFGTDLLQPRSNELLLVGNLQPGSNVATARQRAPVLAARLDALQPGDDPRELIISPPSRFSLGSSSPADESFLLLYASLTLALGGAVLLVACLNLANMLLARGASRRKEIAIRLAIGATRARIVRQLVTESLLLSLAGGGAGLFVSLWSSDAMLTWAQSAFASSPVAMTIHPAIDAWLLGAMFVVSVVATLAFSLVPALRSTRVDLVDDLKQLSGGPTTAGRWNRFFSLRHCLVMGQLALSLMLLFAAGLFVRGSVAASGRDVGFSTAGQVVANVDYNFGGLDRSEIKRRQNALLDRANTLPGVASTALASSVPFNFELRYVQVFPAGVALPADRTVNSGRRAGYAAVTRGYFSTLGIPLLRGRDFTDAESRQEGTRNVAIIDEVLARTLFSDVDALGRHFVNKPADAVGQPDREIEIVGIVRSPEDDVFERRAPFRIYRPLGQVHETNTYLHVKAASPAAALLVLDRLRTELRDLDPATPLLSVRPLGSYLERNINVLLIQLAASAFSAFGLIAVVLAIIGMYGVKSHAVAQRTREIGIRLALGARAVDVVKLIVRQGGGQIAVAVTIGIVLALLAGQALSKMLYRVQAFDPLLLALAVGIIAVTALVATWLPARRAAKIDPSTALRSE
ncbi:MAG: ABC transporter permease [Opitutus sp.]